MCLIRINRFFLLLWTLSLPLTDFLSVSDKETWACNTAGTTGFPHTSSFGHLRWFRMTDSHCHCFGFWIQSSDFLFLLFSLLTCQKCCNLTLSSPARVRRLYTETNMKPSVCRRLGNLTSFYYSVTLVGVFGSKSAAPLDFFICLWRPRKSWSVSWKSSVVHETHRNCTKNKECIFLLSCTHIWITSITFKHLRMPRWILVNIWGRNLLL